MKTKSKISGYIIRSATYAVFFSVAFVAFSWAFNSANSWHGSGGATSTYDIIANVASQPRAFYLEYGDQDLCNTGQYPTDPKAGATLVGLPPGIVTFATHSFQHMYPFSPVSGDYPGTDQIYVGSVQTGFHDGNSMAPQRINGPQVITLDYSSLVPPGQSIATLTLGIAADDFQFPVWGQPFTASINGVTDASLTNTLNSLNLISPSIKFFSIGIDPARLTNSNTLTLAIDGGGDGGDGWAFDFLTVGVTLQTTPTCAPTPSGMVAWYPGDGNANDIARGNNGTLHGGATFAAGEVQQAFSLNGSDAFVEAPNTSAIDPTIAGSQDAWVYFNQVPSAAGHKMQIIGIGSVERDFDLQADEDDHFRFYIHGGGCCSVTSTTVIQAGVWYHVAGTWDSTVGIKIYVNGSLEDSNATQITREQSGQPLMIGNQPFFGPRLFNGLIDEAEVFDRALTDVEVQRIFDAGSAGKCKPRIAPTPRPRPTPFPRPTL